MAHKVVAFLSGKGGCGKTTLAVCVAAELAHRGKTVTLVDADPAGGATAWCESGNLADQVQLIREPGEAVQARAAEASRRGVVLIESHSHANSQ